jgi:hypothetical protein
MEKIPKVLEMTPDIEVQKSTIEKFFAEEKIGDLDFKYFCLLNGIFDKSIYSQIKQRMPLIKSVSLNIYLVHPFRRR